MNMVTFDLVYYPLYLDENSKGVEYPWPIGTFKYGAHCLQRDMSLEEIGLFMLSLTGYEKEDSPKNKDGIIERLIGRQTSILAGGIKVTDKQSGRCILPGCCCGIEGWREWYSGNPWMGHDPDPWIEHADNGLIKIWSDGAIDNQRSSFSIDLNKGEFHENMKHVESNFVDFLSQIEAWGKKEQLANYLDLTEYIDKSFDIRPEYMKQEWHKLNNSYDS